MTTTSPRLLFLETEHWTVEQRLDAALPGYLLMSAKKKTTHLWELEVTALEEMGLHLARLQKTIMQVLKPKYLYIGRYGHLKGPSFHFHFIPIYDWVIDHFLKDQRYRALKQFQSRTDGAFEERHYDASELQLYVWREFCESLTPPPLQGPSILEALEKLKKERHA